jgi:para-aminobenzoate synthetase component 2
MVKLEVKYLILMIDNYDSFTYNLVQYLRCLQQEIMVFRNDSLSIEEIKKMDVDMIVLSPGPGMPSNAGICSQVVATFKGKLPILGICLGHQIIGEVFGGKIVRAKEPVHGKVHAIKHRGEGLFRHLPSPLQVTRYHSLIIEKSSLPACLQITAETAAGEIMAIRHKQYMIEGVQFHPEAILTQMGLEMMQNFLTEAKSSRRQVKKCR